jgi:hypothetical protein
MIVHYTAFGKDTACYSCIGCSRCEIVGFQGVDICHSYRPEEIQNKLIDGTCRRFEQERLRVPNEKD